MSKVAIIGCGVAGMTSALYLNRAGIEAVIFEKAMPGGQIVDNSNIMNFPSYKEISGSDLALKMMEQVKDLGVLIKYEEVLCINISFKKKIIKTNKGEYVFDFVIVATGRIPKTLGVLGEDKFKNKGISYCAVCDGALYKNKEVVVVGSSDGAFEGAIYLSKIASKVTLLYRNSFKAKKYLQDIALKINNIDFIKGEVDSFFKEDNIIINLKDNNRLEASGVFIYVGQKPNATFLTDLNVLDDKGYVITNSNLMTSLDGIYAVGDALNKKDYQIIIAMGEAAKVALEIGRRSYE